MTHLYNLPWPQARDAARAGRRVRRVGWLDRWLVNVTGKGLWWIEDIESGEMHVVRPEDFGKTEFLAADWTTVAPDQTVCVWPPEPEPEEPPPPVIPPAPEPPGAPVTMQVTHGSDRGASKSGTIANPLAIAARVVANGTAAESFWINGVRVSVRLGGNNYDTVNNHRFLLGAGQRFTWQFLGRPRNWSGGTVTFHFTP